MKTDRQTDRTNLRCCAEERLIGKGQGQRGAPGDQPASADMQRLLQELQIHQIELEMQNEELTQTRGEAEAERERYTDLYDFAPVGYFTMDRSGLIRRANFAGARLLGLERSRLLNRRFGDFVSPDDGAPFNLFLEKVFKNRGKESCDLFLDGKGSQGSRVHIEAAADERREECRVAVLDVTERVRMEREALKLREELEQRSAEHIAQLEVANKELDSFAYSISHDLRTPLRAIDGYARMILRSRGDQFDEETRTRFEVIRGSVKKMDLLINDLLAFSRLGRKELSVAALDMENIVRGVWKELQDINSDRPMTLRIAGVVPRGMADQGLIVQVVTNFLANAVKFAGFRDEIIVEMGGYEKGRENVYWIRDNGIGFDMAYADKLFGIFQQLHPPDMFEGTGVGLAIVQRIILRHGGRVWAEGKVDEGACFYFTLPKEAKASSGRPAKFSL